MFSHRFAPRPLITARDLTFFALFAVCLMVLAAAPALAQRRDRRAVEQPTPVPPTIELVSDTNVITICPRDTESGTPQVRLTANTGGFTSGNPLRYRYRVSGGRIIGDGANTVWDLSGVAPGSYAASVEVDNGEVGCMAFTSTAVIVRECPPPVIRCPVVRVICPENLAADAPITFIANVSGGDPSAVPTYNWTLSTGTILSGQGTDTIMVDRAGLAGQTVTATVNIGGYDASCTATAACSSTLENIPLSRLFDEFPSVTFDDDKARLDNLAIELQNTPGAQGYIFIFGADRSRTGTVERLIARTRDYLVTARGIDASRLVIVNGGTRPGTAPYFQLYIVPPGAQPPTPRQ
jgi:hypothetical protein